MSAANQCQVVLGDDAIEITREPIASNAKELLPKIHIAKVSPIKINSKSQMAAAERDACWKYRFDVMTQISIDMTDGSSLILELQEITNQPTWSGGTLLGQQTAIDDINTWLGA